MSLEIIPTGAAVVADIRGADLSQPIHPADFEARAPRRRRLA
jgi:hypothetical protein